MELGTWKTIWQVVAAFGGLLAIIGSMAFYLVDTRIQRKEAEAEQIEKAETKAMIQNLSLEKDQAIAKLNAITSVNLGLSKFQGQLDDQIKSAYVRFELDAEVQATDFTQFRSIVWFPKLNSHYEFLSGVAKSEGGQSGSVTLIQKAWEEPGFVGKPVVKDEVTTISKFSALMFDMWLIGRPSRPVRLKLRDMHSTSFRLYVAEKYALRIRRIQIVINGWLVFDAEAKLDSWSKAFPMTDVTPDVGPMVAFEIIRIPIGRRSC